MPTQWLFFFFLMWLLGIELWLYQELPFWLPHTPCPSSMTCLLQYSSHRGVHISSLFLSSCTESHSPPAYAGCSQLFLRTFGSMLFLCIVKITRCREFQSHMGDVISEVGPWDTLPSSEQVIQQLDRACPGTSTSRKYLSLPIRYKVTCQSSELYKDILVPSFYPKSKHCVFQGDLLLFSCAGAHPTHQRICPCRDFIKGQVALCKDCL